MTARARIVLGEYESRRVRVPAPSSADLDLTERLSGRRGSPRLDVRWLASGEVELAASSWVGVIRFSRVDVHVVPKLVGGPLRVLRMMEFAAGVGLIRRLPSDRPLPADGTDLFDLICMLLVEESKVLLRDGLLRDYRPVDDSLDVLRGRLRYRDQMLRRYGQLQPLECQFDEYDSDIPENQLLALALDAARRRAQDPEIRSSALRLSGLMADVCQPITRDVAWYEQAIQYGRRNGRYRPVHELSKLVLRGLAFEDMYDTSSGKVGAFMLDMNIVFERFVSQLVEEALDSSDLRCRKQGQLQAVIRDDVSGRSYSTIKPDLVIEHRVTGRSVPIDVKYKLYGDKKVTTGDIYQLFLYAYALAADESSRRAGILYPTTVPMEGPALTIRPLEGPAAARISGAGLDVATMLELVNGTGRPQLYETVRNLIRRITGFEVAPEQLSA